LIADAKVTLGCRVALFGSGAHFIKGLPGAAIRLHQFG
jgi:hypothetical protein